MGYTTGTRYEQWYDKWWSTWPNICNSVWYHRSAMGSRYYRNDPDPDSRTKPAPPLFLHPTSRGPFYLDEQEFGIASKWSQPLTINCPERNYTEYHSCLKAYTAPYQTFDEGPWELQLALRVKDIRVSLAEDLAEHRESIKFVTDSAVSLARTIRNFRKCLRGNCRATRRQWQRLRNEPLDNVAKGYLGYTFGVSPMVSTASALLEAHVDRLARPIYHVVNFGANSDINDNFTDAWGQKVAGYRRCRTRGKVWVQMKPNAGIVTIGNPAEWAWAVVPFSFMVDWFFDFGDYLVALDAYRGVSGMTGYVTFSKKSHYNLTNVVPSGTFEERGATFKRREYERRVISGPPSIPLRVRYTPTKSLRRMVTALALLRVVSRP